MTTDTSGRLAGARPDALAVPGACCAECVTRPVETAAGVGAEELIDAKLVDERIGDSLVHAIGFVQTQRITEQLEQCRRRNAGAAAEWPPVSASAPAIAGRNLPAQSGERRGTGCVSTTSGGRSDSPSFSAVDS